MKFYLGEGTEIELAPEISEHVIVINESKFEYNRKIYIMQPVEFKIDDIYFLLYNIVKDNPGKKIFIQRFEPLANNFYAMYFAVEA